MSVTNMNV